MAVNETWWRAVMHDCLGKRGIAPDAFWKMSLPELDAVLVPGAVGSSVPGRSQLVELMDRFPDTGVGTRNYKSEGSE
jgi:uncharacterized phage protein (TIGR02216 family)